MLASMEAGLDNSLPEEKISNKPNQLQQISPFYQKREIMRLPPSAKFIMYLLRSKGAMNRKRIIRETLMPDRTVGFALKLLLEKNLIRKEDPESLMKRTPEKRHRRRKRDRRITNYNIISTILPFEMV